MKKKSKPKPARTIRPHKGGRTMRLEGRFTPEEASVIWNVIEYRGLSFSDWIVSKATQEEQEILSASK